MKVSLLLSAAVLMSASATHAFAAPLSGQVTSAKEGAMEGVLVTAKKDGSSVAVTVISDEKGHYAFPADRLETGHYSLKIRALGYILDGPRSVDVTGSGATADVKLKEAMNLAPQLTNADWLNSAPGTEQEKRDLVACATCHTLSRPLTSAYTKDQLIGDVFPRMAAMASQAFPVQVQKRAEARDQARTFGGVDRLANYISSINLSSAADFKFPLKGAGRPHGKDTHVIITSYDLPRKSMQPHDSVKGPDGFVWVSDFGENSLQRLDPKTGQVKEYTYAPTRPGFSNGNLDVDGSDRCGDVRPQGREVHFLHHPQRDAEPEDPDGDGVSHPLESGRQGLDQRRGRTDCRALRRQERQVRTMDGTVQGSAEGRSAFGLWRLYGFAQQRLSDGFSEPICLEDRRQDRRDDVL
jgi:hypothetical protein